MWKSYKFFNPGKFNREFIKYLWRLEAPHTVSQGRKVLLQPQGRFWYISDLLWLVGREKNILQHKRKLNRHLVCGCMRLEMFYFLKHRFHIFIEDFVQKQSSHHCYVTGGKHSQQFLQVIMRISEIWFDSSIFSGERQIKKSWSHSQCLLPLPNLCSKIEETLLAGFFGL